MNYSFGGRLASLALILAAGVGCSREAGPGTASAPDSVENASAELEVLHSRPADPVSIAEAFKFADGTAKPLIPGTLASIEGGVHCSVDSVNEGVVTDAVLQRSAPARFSGFIALPSSGSHSLVVLANEARAYYARNMVTQARPDIAQSKGIEGGTVSDYSTFVNIQNVEPGRYTVLLISSDGNSLARCASSEVTVQ